MTVAISEIFILDCAIKRRAVGGYLLRTYEFYAHWQRLVFEEAWNLRRDLAFWIDKVHPHFCIDLLSQPDIVAGDCLVVALD